MPGKQQQWQWKRWGRRAARPRAGPGVGLPATAQQRRAPHPRLPATRVSRKTALLHVVTLMTELSKVNSKNKVNSQAKPRSQAEKHGTGLHTFPSALSSPSSGAHAGDACCRRRCCSCPSWCRWLWCRLLWKLKRRSCPLSWRFSSWTRSLVCIFSSMRLCEGAGNLGRNLR